MLNVVWKCIIGSVSKCVTSKFTYSQYKKKEEYKEKLSRRKEIFLCVANLENLIGTLRSPMDNTENKNKALMTNIIKLRNKFIDKIKPDAEIFWEKSRNEIENIIKLVDMVLDERKYNKRKFELRYSGGDDKWLPEFYNHVKKLKEICKI